MSTKVNEHNEVCIQNRSSKTIYLDIEGKIGTWELPPNHSMSTYKSIIWTIVDEDYIKPEGKIEQEKEERLQKAESVYRLNYKGKTYTYHYNLWQNIPDFETILQKEVKEAGAVILDWSTSYLYERVRITTDKPLTMSCLILDKEEENNAKC